MFYIVDLVTESLLETLAQPKERSLAEYYADTLKISPLKKGNKNHWPMIINGR